MHILQLANFYGPESGGIRIALDELAARYAAGGHRCSLIVPGERDAHRRTGDRTVYTVRSPRIPGLGGYRGIIDRHAVRSLIDELAPDVVELSDKTSLVEPAARARRRGAAVVMISHERVDMVVGEAISSHRVVGRGIRVFNRRLAAQADAIVCASHFAAAEFAAFDTPVVHVPLGVDLVDFRPATIPWPRAGRPLDIVSVVRLSPEKRPELLVELSAELLHRSIDHRLHHFGGGPLRGRLAAQARAAGLPVSFHGHTDRRRLALEIARADVAIAPGPHETFGLAAVEILACGTPIVVPDHGALPEHVVDGVGAVCARTPAGFADGVEWLSAGDRDEQRRRARRHAERYDWDHTAERMLDLFAGLVGRAGGDPTAAIEGPIAVNGG